MSKVAKDWAGRSDLIEAPAPATAAKPVVKGGGERITFFIAPEVAERLRDAVFYTPGETLSSFVEHAITETIGGLERKRGEPFPKRERQLRAGRPPRMPR